MARSLSVKKQLKFFANIFESIMKFFKLLLDPVALRLKLKRSEYSEVKFDKSTNL